MKVKHMKVKLVVEIHADIPGEFQDDKLAINILDQEMRDLLSVAVQYDKYDHPEITFDEISIINYIPGLGKL